MSDDLAGVPFLAPPLPGRVMFSQDWLDLAFLHWPVLPESVARFFPPDVRPDVWHDGMTYVGLVPFRMSGAGFGTLPAVPYFGSFLEWNVRLYSVDDAGRHGVVFRSLDCTRLPIVAFARAVFGIGYRYAGIDTHRRDATITWRMQRRERRRPRSSMTLRVGEATELTPLEKFLTSRWGMHARVGPRAMWVPNHHGPWQVHDAAVEQLSDELVAAAGVVPAGPMLRPLWSPGVHAQFALPRLVPRPA